MEDNSRYYRTLGVKKNGGPPAAGPGQDRAWSRFMEGCRAFFYISPNGTPRHGSRLTQGTTEKTPSGIDNQARSATGRGRRTASRAGASHAALKVVFKQNGEPVQTSLCRRILQRVNRRLSTSRRFILAGLQNTDDIIAS